MKFTVTHTQWEYRMSKAQIPFSNESFRPSPASVTGTSVTIHVDANISREKLRVRLWKQQQHSAIIIIIIAAAAAAVCTRTGAVFRNGEHILSAAE